MELPPYLLHSVWTELFVQNKYNFQKQGHFFLICRKYYFVDVKKWGVKMNSFFQTCLARSKLSTLWLRAGCERQGNNSWASALFWVPFTTSTAEGSGYFHPAGAHRWQQERGHTPHSTCSSICSQSQEHFEHFQSNFQSAGNLVCSLVWSWFRPPPLQKIIFYSKFSLLKATEEEKSPSWSQGQIWCLCSVKPHFFCHKLISSSADSQGHFNFTSEISPEEAKLFYSLENIKWLRLPEAMK